MVKQSVKNCWSILLGLLGTEMKTPCTFRILNTTHPMTEHHIVKDLYPEKRNHVIWWKIYLRTGTYCKANLSQRQLSEETVTYANTSTVLMESHVLQTNKFQFLCLLQIALPNMYISVAIPTKCTCDQPCDRRCQQHVLLEVQEWVHKLLATPSCYWRGCTLPADCSSIEPNVMAL
jgi:hypothetical protein